ncbi:glycoside hydrolase family 113 [Christiangramia sediminicola]|uniref:Glycoside hydrolase n=1 Tax=Christiangramia sediminicola TaxID=3073267 RepID=A0ABU1ELD8_9FLAO|nr:glycoside hydrolase [Christiangramia sp. SM2212]MDR5589200.1 glycoside hydrolase [Christiangramia sp. SM2212]
MFQEFRNKCMCLILLTISVLLASCQAEIPVKKINGISLVASRDSLKPEHLEPIVKLNANSVALMPYAFMPNSENTELVFNIERQWFGERADGIEHTIALLKQKDLRIMMKPHIWIRNGEFTGDLNFENENNWRKFENSFREYMLLYAKISEDEHIEIFCIGTELFNFVKSRPEFWDQLITDIRKVFSGKLVYAENWDKVDQVDIWERLDFIGADAYFPISDKVSPNETEIAEGWLKHAKMLQELSEKYDRKVLFTEYGYRSIDFALKEPWNSSREISKTNHGLQARALKVLYEDIWPQNWFAGGYLWKWHHHESSGGLTNDRFTPQNKPAEQTIGEYYGKFRN